MCKTCDEREAAREAEWKERLAAAKGIEHKSILHAIKATDEVIRGYVNSAAYGPEDLDRLERVRVELWQHGVVGPQRSVSDTVLVFGAVLVAALGAVDEFYKAATPAEIEMLFAEAQRQMEAKEVGEEEGEGRRHGAYERISGMPMSGTRRDQ